MTGNKLFTAAYWFMHFAPIYAVLAIVFGIMGAPGLAVLAPLLLFVLAAAYLASRKCPRCGRTIYTPENFSKVKGALSKIPVYRFQNCPACGEPL